MKAHTSSTVPAPCRTPAAATGRWSGALLRDDRDDQHCKRGCTIPALVWSWPLSGSVTRQISVSRHGEQAVREPAHAVPRSRSTARNSAIVVGDRSLCWTWRREDREELEESGIGLIPVPLSYRFLNAPSNPGLKGKSCILQSFRQYALAREQCRDPPFAKQESKSKLRTEASVGRDRTAPTSR